MSARARRFWAVVPAAGSGTRMRAGTPKQYLPLCGRSVLEHTLGVLLASGAFERVVVVLAPDDAHFSELALAGDTRVVSAVGGGLRCESVLHGLAKLSELADADDWVAVHDAVRPCLAAHDLQAVLAAVRTHADGALLAAPLAETLKRADAQQCVVETLDREHLWRALTPQVFPLQRLREALQAALAQGHAPTDEAQAMELAGFRPRLVPGRADNLKITHPDDLRLAETLLAAAAAP